MYCSSEASLALDEAIRLAQLNKNTAILEHSLVCVSVYLSVYVCVLACAMNKWWDFLTTTSPFSWGVVCE